MFQYSLRYSMDYRTNTKEKDDKLLSFCENGMIDNVTFFMNSEEINAGHLTAQATQLWLDAIKKLSDRLAEIEVSTSLNPFSTIMHSDRGQIINPEIGFEPLVGMDGTKAQSMGCPADPKWRNYLADRYAQYATLHPRELWLEDDFRHFNHSPLKLACFCNLHMKIYREKLGENITRKKFVEAIFQSGEPTPERKVYLDTARQEMIDTAAQLEKRVHEVSPETNLALMTSFPDWHALEGRDWQNLFDKLSGSDHPFVVRPHLPAYNEIAPLKYSRTFEDYTRTTAAYLGSKAVLYPELENYMYSPFAKSLKFTQFQLETTPLVGAKGILMNLFDMNGNGINDDYHYAKMLADSKPFLNEITSRNLQMEQTRGINVLVDQDSSYTLQTTSPDLKGLLPHETNWAALLSAFGFSTTITAYTNDLHLEQQILAISGQFFRNLTPDQIEQLIRDNVVLLDGESVQVILDKGLGDLLHIKNATWHPVRSGYQTFEAADGHTVEGVENPRISMLQHTGDYLQIDYQPDSEVEVWSHAYNEFDQKLGDVMTMIDGHILVMPMNADPKYGWEAQYVGFKQGLYQQMLDSVVEADYLVKMPNTKLVVNQTENEFVLWTANFTLDDYNQITWHPAQEITAEQATVVERRDNQTIKREVTMKKNDGTIVFPVSLPHMQIVQIRI